MAFLKGKLPVVLCMNLYNALYKKLSVTGISAVLSKAFDVVGNYTLMNKLKFYDTRENEFSLFY